MGCIDPDCVLCIFGIYGMGDWEDGRMTLSERLRDRAKKTWLKEIPCDEGVFPIMDLVGEAADALDAKDARIKELEGALRAIARGMLGGQIMYASDCWAIAREALK